jgi:hypothetical protein
LALQDRVEKRAYSTAYPGRGGGRFLPNQGEGEGAYCLLMQRRRSDHIALLSRDVESFLPNQAEGGSIVPNQAEACRGFSTKIEAVVKVKGYFF